LSELSETELDLDTHTPQHTLTIFPLQNQYTPFDLVPNEETKAPFMDYWAQVDITDENKSGQFMMFTRSGITSHLPEVPKAGADPAHTDSHGRTSLWVACKNKDEAAAAVGALNLQAKLEYSNRSALQLASDNGMVSTIAKLLALSADASSINFLALKGETRAAFVEYCLQVDVTDENKNALMMLCVRLDMTDKCENALVMQCVRSRLPALLHAEADFAGTDEV
jgi:hypothetical protein